MIKWIKRKLRPPYIEFVGVSIFLFISIFCILAVRMYDTYAVAKGIEYHTDSAALASLIALENKKPVYDFKTTNTDYEVYNNSFLNYNSYKNIYDIKDSFTKKNVFKPFYEKPVTPIYNLNVADSFELEKLNGIGIKLASRIVKYREALGGFLNLNQLKEIFGLDTTLLKKLVFIIDKNDVKKIDLNTVSLDILKRHPYIKYKYGNCLYNYILQNKPITKEKWERIVCIPKADKLRIKDYLIFE